MYCLTSFAGSFQFIDRINGNIIPEKGRLAESQGFRVPYSGINIIFLQLSRVGCGSSDKECQHYSKESCVSVAQTGILRLSSVERKRQGNRANEKANQYRLGRCHTSTSLVTMPVQAAASKYRDVRFINFDNRSIVDNIYTVNIILQS